MSGPVKYLGGEWYVEKDLGDGKLRLSQLRHYSDGDSICEVIADASEIGRV